MTLALEPIDTLIPASYNPRAVDPKRLDLVRLSLRKLGWLLPVYATPAGEILSGHQRTFVARDIGYTHAPVVRMVPMEANVRKAVNILFNRATNDMDIDSESSEMTRQLLQEDVLRQTAALPDWPVEDVPCLHPVNEPIAPLLKVNAGRWIGYARAMAASLYRYKILMPIVLDPDDLVVNGIGRLQLLAGYKKSHVPAIRISKQRADLAASMLNLLSMDFDITTHYSDVLRHNSFRRSRRTRAKLGKGFIFAIPGRNITTTADFDITQPSDLALWKKTFGSTVLDFGAGHLHETRLLRAGGVAVTPFEPYHVRQTDTIDKAASINIVREFLNDVAAGKRWRSIFIASVLNSVPFRVDRECIVKICSACCSKNTRVYALTSSDTDSFAPEVICRKKNLNAKAISQGGIQLDYERGIMLREISKAPKVQKYHTPTEMYDLFHTAFNAVQIKRFGTAVTAIAAKPIGTEGLREALEFEFDLPYPDGSHMGLVKDAIAAFEKRLGVTL